MNKFNWRKIDFSKPFRGGPVDHGFDYFYGVNTPNNGPFTWFENDRLLALPTAQAPKAFLGTGDPMAPGWTEEGILPGITNKTIEYIQEQTSETPFFIYLPLTSPHTPISPSKRFQGKSGLTTYGFTMENGKKVANFAARINKSKGMETDRKAATEKEVITIAANTLNDYTGSYELQPGFIIKVTTTEGKIFGQATGQPEVEMFPEAEDTFFLKVVAAQLVFGRNDSGEVVNLTLNQGDQSLKGNKK
jgi:hypothetical protein